MNYTDKDVQAIVNTQVELKTKELQNINDKLSSALNSAETKIDKAIMELDDPFEDEDGDGSWHEKVDIYKRQINKAISILKGDK